MYQIWTKSTHSSLRYHNKHIKFMKKLHQQSMVPDQKKIHPAIMEECSRMGWLTESIPIFPNVGIVEQGMIIPMPIMLCCSQTKPTQWPYITLQHLGIWGKPLVWKKVPWNHVSSKNGNKIIYTMYYVQFDCNVIFFYVIFFHLWIHLI